MTTDIVVPSVMAIIIDRTGKAQAVSVGTSADLEIKEAIKGSILEAIRSRNISFRKMFFSDSRMKEEAIKRRKELESNFSRIKTFSERFLFWSPLEMIEKIDFLFKGRKKQLGREELNKYQDFSIKEKLKAVLNFLKEKNIDIYGVDITLPQIKKSGLYVVKVVSPQLQPLYLDERLKCLGGGRLYRVPVILGYRQKPLLEEEFNPIPHPFL
jgi:ribosomal protein S12 methylthiotransferase accessory factor